MTLSVRARLTVWYTTVVVVVLVTFVATVSLAQRRLGLARLDAELLRLSLTVEGVMRTELGEGLTLQDSADEASLEVVAPDRSLRLQRPDGGLLAEWGHPFPATVPSFSPVTRSDDITTHDGSAGAMRVLRRSITTDRAPYVATIGAPLGALTEEHREVVTALWMGTALTLLVSVAGGWLVARQALRPLTDMAQQAAATSGAHEPVRLHAPGARDELGRLADAFNALLDRISTSARVQRQFMADASHELRTPLSVVRTTAQVALTRSHRDEAEYREALEIVSAQATRLTQLVEDMLFLSRADATGLRLRRDAVYVDELLAEVVGGLTVIGAARSVSVTLTTAPEVLVIGDEAQLRRLATNLLSNAIRHATPGSVVAVDLAVAVSEVRIRITNQGEPIPAADQSRIFDRFVSLDPGASGAGLGLPIARWIAEAHAGSVTLVSSDAAGTTFDVRLPL